MKKHKIAFVTYGMNSGGAERVISILSNRLSATYKVFIIILIDAPSFYTLNPEVTLIKCRNESKRKNNFFSAISSNYKSYKSIKKVLSENKIDICIGFMTANNILCTLAAKSIGIPVIISERNNPYLQGASTGTMWKILRRIVYPMSDILIVQTQRVKSFYVSFISKEKLLTIANPINPDFKNSLATLKKKNVILNVGSLEKQKAQDILIRAFSESKLDDWQLHIIGDGSLKCKLTKLIIDFNLEERVFLIGKKSNIAEHYASSKIFAFSSRYEGFPNALLEAMFFGLPVISTDCPTGPSEIMQNGISGYLVPVDDSAAIAEKLRLLANDANMRQKLGENAQTAVRPFQIEEIIGQWSDIIQKLLSKK